MLKKIAQELKLAAEEIRKLKEENKMLKEKLNSLTKEATFSSEDMDNNLIFGDVIEKDDYSGPVQMSSEERFRMIFG